MHPRHPSTDALQTRVSIRALPAAADPLALCASLGDRSLRWWLDSALVEPRLGAWSFVGADPYAVLRVYGTTAVLETHRAARPDFPPGSRSLHARDPFALVRTLLPPAPPAAELEARAAREGARVPPFIGGAVGAFGYELVERLEDVHLTGRDELGLPDLTLALVDRVVAFDHARGTATAIGLGFGRDADEAFARSGDACDAVSALALRESASTRPVDPVRAPRAASQAGPPAVDAFHDERSYAAAVESIRERIAAGDVYQANLTHRLTVALGARSPFALYRALRRASPAPFAAYLELPDVTVLSSSPERFLRVTADGACESRPIKGTRPRGATPEEDALLAKELASAEKDGAENLMIVDLVRNDLGRVCATGSVAVPELRAVERYATVFQLVSTVTGRLAADHDALDAVRAAFPPGSMTGAPKLAAIAVLDALEPVRRGIYAGALGYLDVRGGLDLSVVIRTLLTVGDRGHVHVGGGVVADSDGAAEYRETLDKARALLEVLEVLGTDPPDPG